MVSPAGSRARVAALAGRRIDTLDAKSPRFPLARVPAVENALRSVLIESGIELLVSSAACGADLVALMVARSLGVRCRVVLPFSIGRFRTTSVTDRPGNWGPLFDEVIDDAARQGDLIILSGNYDDKQAYSLANHQIIHEAAMHADLQAVALILWDGRRRVGEDATAEFQDLARKAGFQEHVISTV